MASGEKLRLFFAIVPDDAARTRLDALARETARIAGGRASAAHTLHLTLVFVGTVDVEAAAAVRDAGDALRFSPFALRFDRLGSFARARIAWTAPSTIPGELADANRDLVRVLADRGIATEARPYRPHVTLARSCERVVDGPVEPPIAWRADRVVLMSSRLLSEGARYREIAGWTAT